MTKTIAGPLAGHQGPVTIHVACNGTALSPDFMIAAGTPAGSVSHSFDDIPAGSVCTVTETADGATATVTATVTGNDQKVTVPAGKVVPVNLMDVYQGARRLPESDQDDRWTGRPPARSHRHPGGLWRPAARLRVPHPGPRHRFQSRYFNRLPAGSRCTVTETANGHTSTVGVVATGRHKKTTISPNRIATTHLTDSFSRRPPPRPPPGPPPSGLG